MKSMRKRVVIAALALLSCGGGWFFYGKAVSATEVKDDVVELSSPANPRPVAIEVLGGTETSFGRRYPGVVKADQEAFLAFRVGGPITSLEVQLGDLVSKGQRLAQIDQRDFQDQIKVLEAELSGAMASMENAEQDHHRYRSLLDEKVVAQADYDQIKKNVTMAKAAVQNIKAQLTIARHRLEDTVLKAPFDGIVSVRKVENHEMVSPGQVVMGLLDIATLRVSANVPEGALAKGGLSEGAEVEISFPSMDDFTVKGVLKEWSTSPDSATKTYSVTFTFPAPKDVNVLPGMTAEVLWVEGAKSKPSELTVPLGAVVSGSDGGSYVWVYDPEEGVVRSREVSLGKLQADDRLPVVDGLNSGENLVVAGADFLTEGMAVTPLKR
ncbi:MAG: efflux RND transporter periplasmic adaptor subunit [Synergistales bacterium]|nr:efflux RND transporter periplasmic adaptor subunit [Synergistales bacterium]